MPKIPRTFIFDDLEYKGGQGVEVEATEEREFSVGGKHYKTYLTEDNAAAFDEALAAWTEFAEEVAASGPRASSRKASTGSANNGRPRDRNQSFKIREWAKGQQFTPPVGDKGRIPGHVMDAYYAAHPEEAPAA